MYDSVDALPIAAPAHTLPSPAYSTGHDNGNRMNSGRAKREPDWKGHDFRFEPFVAFSPRCLSEALACLEAVPPVDRVMCLCNLPCGECPNQGDVGCACAVTISLPTTIYRVVRNLADHGLVDCEKFVDYCFDNHGLWTPYESLGEVYDRDIPF